jgi:hypothetical protein
MTFLINFNYSVLIYAHITSPFNHTVIKTSVKYFLHNVGLLPNDSHYWSKHVRQKRFILS